MPSRLQTMGSRDLLRTIDADMLQFHAKRFAAGEHFKRLVEQSQGDRLTPKSIAAAVHTIALAGRDEDGVDYGSISCLGGYPLMVWGILLARYGQFIEHR